MGKIELALKIQTLLNGLHNAGKEHLEVYKNQLGKNMSSDLRNFIKNQIDFFTVQNKVIKTLSEYFNEFVKK